MQRPDLARALEELKALHQTVLGRPAPAIEASEYLPFPPGIAPEEAALQEVAWLKQLATEIQFAPAPVAWVPQADCFGTDDKFMVRLELPDVGREELKVLVHEGECVVRGSRKQPDELAHMRPMSLERPWGPFERRFQLPPGSDADGLTARFHDGMLELEVAVSASRLSRETQVQAA